MQEAWRKAEKVARSDLNVLLVGETGTGKTLMAEYIHRKSPRADQPLLKLDCTVLHPNLLESELFGHEKGAFTGAVRQKRGLLELADGTTLFLDEVGDLPPSAQAKLLTALEERRFRRLGGTQTLDVDFRLIAATRKNL